MKKIYVALPALLLCGIFSTASFADYNHANCGPIKQGKESAFICCKTRVKLKIHWSHEAACHGGSHYTSSDCTDNSPLDENGKIGHVTVARYCSAHGLPAPVFS